MLVGTGIIRRTTFTLDDGVVTPAKAIAHQTNTTIGEVVSDLARWSLRQLATPDERNGIPLLPVRAKGVMVTSDLVNALRDELL